MAANAVVVRDAHDIASPAAEVPSVIDRAIMHGADPITITEIPTRDVTDDRNSPSSRQRNSVS